MFPPKSPIYCFNQNQNSSTLKRVTTSHLPDFAAKKGDFCKTLTARISKTNKLRPPFESSIRISSASSTNYQSLRNFLQQNLLFCKRNLSFWGGLISSLLTLRARSASGNEAIKKKVLTKVVAPRILSNPTQSESRFLQNPPSKSHFSKMFAKNR